MRSNLDLFFLLLILTTMGCVKPAVPPSSASASLRWATSALPVKQDWTDCTSGGCTMHASLVMEGLVCADRKETLALAEKVFFVSPREMRVQIKRGVLWSDGAELKAKDFIFSWKRSWLKCHQRPATKYFFPIVGTETGCGNKNLVGVEALSDYELRIRLSSPSPFFARRLAHPLFFPKRVDAPEATLGPFVFIEKGKYAPNLSFQRSRRPSRGIHFMEVVDEVERVSLFLEGSVDVADALSPKTSGFLKNNPNLQPWLTGQKVFLLFDSAQSQKIRQALVESLSLSESIELLDFGLEENRALMPEIDSPKSIQAVNNPASLKEKFSGVDFSLSVAEAAGLPGLATNLRAQWNRRLSADVKPTPRHRKNGVALKQWTPDWFDPALPRFVISHAPTFSDRDAAVAFWNKIQRDWVEKEFLVAPVFEVTGYVLRKASLGPMERSTSGVWAFDRIAHQ